jgi:hypothetical protein
MKYHHQQESASKYFFIGIAIVVLAMALLSDPGNVHVAVLNAGTAISNLFHVLSS